jgi:hypothetical protein
MRPNPSNCALFAALVALLGSPPVVGAQERILPSSEEESPQVTGRSGTSASEGAEFLLLPVGARAVGMGGAVTGMRGAGDLVLWNPSGVARSTIFPLAGGKLRDARYYVLLGGLR